MSTLHLEQSEVEWWKHLYTLTLGSVPTDTESELGPRQSASIRVWLAAWRADRGVKEVRTRCGITNGLTIQEMDAL